MTTKYKALKLLGLSAVVLPSVSFAAAPINYDQWSADSGAINTTAACSAAGVSSCRTLAEDNGFIQQEIIVDDYAYIQLIVTDPNADGAADAQTFTSESFVPFAFVGQGISQGVAAKQNVRDEVEGFTDQVVLQRSMMRFRDPGIVSVGDINNLPPTPAEEMFSIHLTQVFDRDDMQSTFDYINYTQMTFFPAATPDTNDVIGSRMSISQIIPIDPTGSNDVDPNARQQFEHRASSGVMGNTSSPPLFPTNYYVSAPLTPAGSMTLGGDTVSWDEADTVSTNWLVQSDIVDADIIAVSVQNVISQTSGDEATELSTGGLTAPLSPFDWDEPTFGPEPIFP